MILERDGMSLCKQKGRVFDTHGNKTGELTLLNCCDKCHLIILDIKFIGFKLVWYIINEELILDIYIYSNFIPNIANIDMSNK